MNVSNCNKYEGQWFRLFGYLQAFQRKKFNLLLPSTKFEG